MLQVPLGDTDLLAHLSRQSTPQERLEEPADPILDALIGHTPGDVGADRYASAWQRHAKATLTEG